MITKYWTAEISNFHEVRSGSARSGCLNTTFIKLLTHLADN